MGDCTWGNLEDWTDHIRSTRTASEAQELRVCNSAEH